MARQHIIEHYKGYFADAANRPHHHSSSLSWAETARPVKTPPGVRDYFVERSSTSGKDVDHRYR
jgi:hypothetical protein